ncbi:MAG: YceH family protein [Phycisphaerae bacterium]|jgi:uncharacterized protein YceH (UPF0502 family)
MTKPLSDPELRVLGVLIEKSLAQPGAYPLTANAITTGCNQKQNRDPIVSYSESDVLQTLQRLESKGLVEHASPAQGARVYRYAHRAEQAFRWDRHQRAIMAELMLRGRQTAGELRTHAARMAPFADLGIVAHNLESLASHDPPWVEELPREPGRSATRFRHLLSADEPATVPKASEPSEAAEPAPVKSNTADIDERLARLEARVDELGEIVKQLQSRSAGSATAHNDRPTDPPA